MNCSKAISLILFSDYYSTEYVREVFQYNSDNIQSQLPLPGGGVLCFNLALCAVGDFLYPTPPQGKNGRLYMVDENRARHSLWT